MRLEDYFDVQSPDDIRIQGHRIGIESILYEYLEHHRSPERIAKIYPSLELDQVYATILYYLRNRESIDRYMKNWLDFGEQMRAEQARNPSPVVARLRRLLAMTAAGGETRV
jgi:uncharacterized protein (DUF433 family)